MQIDTLDLLYRADVLEMFQPAITSDPISLILTPSILDQSRAHGIPRLRPNIPSNPLETDQMSAVIGILVDFKGQWVGEMGKTCG